jgi:ATP-dependent Lon protease
MSRHRPARPEPPGFSKYNVNLGVSRDVGTLHLYLPHRLLNQFERERREELERRLAERAARIKEQEAAHAERELQHTQSLKAEEAVDQASNSEGPHRPVAGEDYDPRLEHLVYTPAAVAALAKRATLSTPDREVRKRDEALAKRLLEAGPLRAIASPSDALPKLAELRLNQPQFAAVVDLVRNQLLLATRTGKGLRIPPLLLDGEPGIGKTHFATALAEALGTTVTRISFDSPITGATIVGSERRWGNTSYGCVFETLCLGGVANPIFILDELDKAGSRREWNPTSVLLTLLEASTASHARDISLDFEFDGSLITWIATSNDSRYLSDAIRSRFREFHIQRAGAAEAISCAAAVVTRAFADLQLIDFESPGKDVSVALAHLNARAIKQAFEQAVANAIAGGRNWVSVQDLPSELVDTVHGSEATGSSGTDKGWLH